MVFWRRRRRAVGVVLDSEEARAVELEGSPQSPELTAWGRIPLPKGSISDGMVFWRRRRRAVGVVLDSEEARAVELEGSPQSPELTAWGRIPLPKGSISEGISQTPKVWRRPSLLSGKRRTLRKIT